MRIPKGWFVLYQPEYKSPSVFDLNDLGRFKFFPSVSKPYGARMIVDEIFNIQIQCLYLMEEEYVDQSNGQRYSHVNQELLISLDPDLAMDNEGVKAMVSDRKIVDEIIAVHKEWYESSVPLKEGEIDREELEKALITAIDRRKKIIFKELERKNHLWIKSVLPRKITDFKRGLYPRMAGELYPQYQQQGGEDDADALIRKINLFSCIYDDEEMIKPDGTTWRDEDEQWNCWVSLVGSESEANRLTSVMKTVFPPVQKELTWELGM